MLRLRDLAPWALLALAVAFAPSALGPTGTSLALAATAALGAALGGLLWAVGAAHAGRAAPLLRGLAWAALLIPPYLSAVGLIELCGPAGRLPRALGWVDGPLPTAQGAIYESWRISGLTLAGAWLPLVGLAVEAAWRRLDPRAVDAARLVGGRFGEWGLRLSVARAPAGVGALAVGIASLGEFATAQLLRVPVLAEAVHLEAHAPLQAAWHSLPLLIAGLVGLGGCLAIARRPLPSAGGARVAPPGWGGWLLAVLGALALLVLGLGLPLGFLLTRLGSRPGSPGIWASALAALDDTWVFARRDVATTGGVAAVTATWVTALALLAVSWTRDAKRLWHLALLVPAVLLAATPRP
ncbi:MAG: hypothetical protein R3F62_15845 [Planctomycetota bacterium]